MEPKVVVITGASAGIGAATAELLGRQGLSLVLVARREDALEAVAARCGGNVLSIVADVSHRVEVRRVVETSLARFGHIEVWINNVGRGISRPPSQLTDDDVDMVMRMNVMLTPYGMQEVLPHFKARNAGHVINISSLLGRVPFAAIRSAYCGAKHFLNALTATFRAGVQGDPPVSGSRSVGVPPLAPLRRRTALVFPAIHLCSESRTGEIEALKPRSFVECHPPPRIDP